MGQPIYGQTQMKGWSVAPARPNRFEPSRHGLKHEEITWILHRNTEELHHLSLAPGGTGNPVADRFPKEPTDCGREGFQFNSTEDIA